MSIWIYPPDPADMTPAEFDDALDAFRERVADLREADEPEMPDPTDDL